ncbi:DUF4184 family protein [Paenibacillus sp. LHD-38]|uniref:DUF4184 family protein n=1 Tax=Paenibacillus sp. LHD-38 TaxID=3072143 RepID=UPI00280E662F|nr:DUF4184 family protein [Paenibacillus sp. LHD-38]MDQ8735236.1 DUF4184 family protein [Paenibacillus sp. LHD-38]
MPFTLSHPLFAAPLKKVIPSLSMTGLILGSLSPDIEYFIAMQPFRSIGHSIEGFFLLVLPICIAFAFGFHFIIKPSLPELLPKIGGIHQYASYLNRTWRMSEIADWIRFIISLFIGFLSHVFLDHFTHSGGWFVLRVPFLQTEFMGDYVYHILQLSLSVLGAAIPGLYFIYRYLDWKRNYNRSAAYQQSRSPFKYWGLFLLAASVLLFGKLMISGNFFSISIWVVAPITAAVLALYLTSILQLAYMSHQKGWGIFFAVLILAIIGGFEWVTYNQKFSTISWILYTWLLTAVLLISSLSIISKSKRYSTN